MTVLSHSPTDMPARRAASFAASRGLGRTPFALHGMPSFMPTPILLRGAGSPMAQLNQRFRGETNGGAVLFLRPESSGFMVNNGLRSRSWAAGLLWRCQYPRGSLGRRYRGLLAQARSKAGT